MFFKYFVYVATHLQTDPELTICMVKILLQPSYNYWQHSQYYLYSLSSWLHYFKEPSFNQNITVIIFPFDAHFIHTYVDDTQVLYNNHTVVPYLILSLYFWHSACNREIKGIAIVLIFVEVFVNEIRKSSYL